VEKGADLVVWLCFEVFRDESQLNNTWERTLFANGFYFAHSADNTPLAVRFGGGYGEGASPKPTQKWQRLAK